MTLSREHFKIIQRFVDDYVGVKALASVGIVCDPAHAGCCYLHGTSSDTGNSLCGMLFDKWDSQDDTAKFRAHHNISADSELGQAIILCSAVYGMKHAEV